MYNICNYCLKQWAANHQAQVESGCHLLWYIMLHWIAVTTIHLRTVRGASCYDGQSPELNSRDCSLPP